MMLPGVAARAIERRRATEHIRPGNGEIEGKWPTKAGKRISAVAALAVKIEMFGAAR